MENNTQNLIICKVLVTSVGKHDGVVVGVVIDDPTCNFFTCFKLDGFSLKESRKT